MSTTDALNGVASPEDFREAARQWLDANVSEHWRKNRGALSEDEEARIRLEWEKQLYTGGYAALSLPEEYGGRSLGLSEEVIFGELAARAEAPDGMGRIGKILVAHTLAKIGTEAQKKTIIPKIVSGEQIWCQGFSEPGSGSDLASVTCSARAVEGGFLVRGRKTWTSYSKYADKCILLARSDENAPRYHNLTMLMVDMHAPGIELSPILQISESQHFSETVFDDVFVPNEDVMGEVGEGWKVAMVVLGNERGLVEAMARYVEIRADMNLLMECCVRPGESTDGVRDLDTRVELVRWQVSKAVSVEEDDDAFLRASSILKLTWSELWQDLTSLALKLSCPNHRDHWRHQYLESRSATIYSGSSEIQRNIIAERVLRMPK